MNRLRLFEAFDLDEYQIFCQHKPPESLLKQLEKAVEKGLLEAYDWQNKRICTTEKGKLFLNELLEMFL